MKRLAYLLYNSNNYYSKLIDILFMATHRGYSSVILRFLLLSLRVLLTRFTKYYPITINFACIATFTWPNCRSHVYEKNLVHRVYIPHTPSNAGDHFVASVFSCAGIGNKSYYNHMAAIRERHDTDIVCRRSDSFVIDSG